MCAHVHTHVQEHMRTFHNMHAPVNLRLVLKCNDREFGLGKSDIQIPCCPKEF